MPVLAGRQDQHDDTSDQIQRRADDLGAPIPACLGEAAEQPLGDGFLQPVDGRGSTVAVAQQAFQVLSVVSCDAHARVQREPAAVVPGLHFPTGLGLRVDPPTAHECRKGATADLGLHHPHGIRIECLRSDEPGILLRVGLENTVDDDDMEVGELVRRGPVAHRVSLCAPVENLGSREHWLTL